MAIRMIGLDLDGTLFDSRKRLTDYTKQVLERAIEKGIVIVPATGRPRVGLPETLLNIPGIRYAIVSNGSAIYDLKEARCIYHNCMDRAKAADLMHRTRSLAHTVQGAFLGEWGYMEAVDSARLDGLSLVEEMKAYLRASRHVVDSLPELIRSSGDAPQKLVLMFLQDEKGVLLDQAEAEKIVAQYPEFSFMSGGVGNIEIVDRQTGKGTALLELGRLLGIAKEEIMAVGDSENDLDMIRKAGLGAAMANGEEIVREYADVIALSNDEDGCAKAIETYALGEGAD